MKNWVLRTVVNPIKNRRKWGKAIDVESLLNDRRELNGTFIGVRLKFPGTMYLGEHQGDVQAPDFKAGPGLVMRGCCIQLPKRPVWA